LVRQPLRAASIRVISLDFLPGIVLTKKDALLAFSLPYSVRWARGQLSPCRLTSAAPWGLSPVGGPRAS
jgi:hypothetical protein